MIHTIMPHVGFDASERKITFYSWAPRPSDLLLSQIKLITNLVTGDIIYSPQIPLLGTLDKSGTYPVLTVDFDTTSMSDTDELQIFTCVIPVSQYCKGFSVHSKNIPVGAPGLLTEFDVDVHVSTETQYLNADTVATLSNGDETIQVFRCSAMDIHDVFVPLLSVPASGATIDSFESYANTSALQAVWVPTGSNISPARSTTAQEGSLSMSLQCRASSVGQYVRRTYSTNQDWSAYNRISLQHMSSSVQTGSTLRVRIGDAQGNWKYYPVLGAANTLWHLHYINLADFTAEAAPVDMANVKYMDILIYAASNTSTEYLDIIQLSIDPSEISGELRVYSFGATAPSGGETIPSSMSFDDQEGFLTFTAPTQKQFARMKFRIGHVGFSEEALTVGNYYGIGIKNVTAGTTLKVYGTTQEQAYVSGKTFLVSSAALGSPLANTSMGFIVISHWEGFPREITFTFDDDPGADSLLYMAYVNPVTSKQDEFLYCRSLNAGENVIDLEIPYNDITTRILGRDIMLRGFFQPNQNSKAHSLGIKAKCSFKKHTPYG